MLVQLLHVAVFSALLFYVGIRRDKLPDAMFPALIGLGSIVIGYHAYKAVVKANHAWVNYVHIFLVGPLLLYIGVQGKETSRKYFELCLMLAFASFGYHLYYLVN